MVRVSGVDEDAVAASLVEPKPAELVVALAAAKAEVVVAGLDGELSEAVVVGCDSMLLMDTPRGPEVVGKPATVEVARERWGHMAGRSGELLTGHAVVRISAGQVVDRAQETMSTTVRWSSPSPAELEAYLASREPLHVAGAFTLDGLGGWFVEGVDGDPSSVIGISLPLTRRLLSAVGVSVTDLWRQ
ncbi:septum formation protein [Crossiella equi]|uniref:Nucleoside triphosphate pyrophosphatase n=1 Tax=Crossiella equi TaxID=130796 RepID=A0ABS5AG74_9PSEU|nr:septum formation protein [Crossiella equi]